MIKLDDITDSLKDELLRCTKRYAPSEMCGVIVVDGGGHAFISMDNVHSDPKNYFEINMFAYEKITREHTVAAIVHSHPTGSSTASDADKHNCNLHCIPYIIVGGDGTLSLITPETVPLVGRSYLHGVYDCFSIVRDYYKRELGIDIDDYERKDEWWTDRANESLYEKHFADQNFVSVGITNINDLRRHDVLICYWGDTVHPNHALIYLGDDGSLTSEETSPCYGSRLYLHHLYGQASTRTILGETRFSSVKLVLRHRSLLDDHS